MEAVKLTTSQSAVLDVIRVGAASAVVVGHLTQPFFSTGIPDLIHLALIAVVIFFVLSGFVIRYVTVRRPGTLRQYSRARATRIYSVVVPALVLTVVADSISRHVDPAFYAVWAQSAPHALQALVANLTFTAQLWFLYLCPLSNSPFWSLSYEVIYYALYACAFYLRGPKRVLWVAAISILAGPKIMLLFPIWLLGCLAHDLYQAWNGSRNASKYLGWASALLTALLGFALVDHRVAHAIGYSHHLLYEEGIRLGMERSSGVVDFFLAGPVSAVFLLTILMASRTGRLDMDGRPARAIRYVSEGTFAIYLFHFPLLVLIAACIPYDHSSTPQKLLILVAVLSICIPAGQACNALKDWLR